MISYSLFLSENLISISLLFSCEQQVQIHSRHLKSPSAARLALSSVPVFGSSACPLASDEAAGACGAHHLLVPDGIAGVAGPAGLAGLAGLAG